MAAVNSLNLSQGVYQQILNAQVGENPRVEAEKRIAYYYSQKGYWMNEMIRTYVSDTTGTENTDTLIKRIKDVGGYGDNSVYVKIRLAKGDTAGARQELDQFRISEPNNNVQHDYLEALIRIEKEQDNIYAVSNIPDLNQKVTALANNVHDGNRIAAVAILKEVANIPYNEWIEPIHFGGSSSKMAKNEERVINESMEVRLYPNPATTTVNIEWKVITGETDNLLFVYNMLGQELLTQPLEGESGVAAINIENLGNGIYNFVVKSGNKTVSTKRVSIQK